MSERRLLVTGATGFVGPGLVTQARRRGWEVIALVLPGDDLSSLGGAQNGVHVVRGTLADIDRWAPDVARLAPEACVHLAWATTPGLYLDTPENLHWLSWSGHLFAKLPEWGIKHVVGVGTCAEYDADHGFLRESTPVPAADPVRRVQSIGSAGGGADRGRRRA